MQTTSIRIQNLPLLVARPALQIRFAGEGKGNGGGKGTRRIGRRGGLNCPGLWLFALYRVGCR
jgi:hypothetical protein